MCYCVQALHAFKAKYSELPRAWNQEDAGKFVELAKEVNSSAHAKVRMGCGVYGVTGEGERLGGVAGESDRRDGKGSKWR